MATPDVTFALADFTDVVTGAGYLVQLSPGLHGYTDSSGELTFSAVTPGSYVLNCPGTGIASYRIFVPNAAGPYEVQNLINSGQGYAAPQTAFEADGKTLVAGSGITLAESGGGSSVSIAVTTLPSAVVSDTAYNATSWDDVTGVAPSKNAVRDKFVTVDAAIAAGVVLNATADALTDDTYQNAVLVNGKVAGETLTQFDAVFLHSDGKWHQADADEAGEFPARGIAVAGAESDAAVTILTKGIVRNDGWSWTVGGTIYLADTAGGLTQTAPSTSGDCVQAVGFALSDDEAYFDFTPAFTLAA